MLLPRAVESLNIQDRIYVSNENSGTLGYFFVVFFFVLLIRVCPDTEYNRVRRRTSRITTRSHHQVRWYIAAL